MSGEARGEKRIKKAARSYIGSTQYPVGPPGEKRSKVREETKDAEQA